MGEDGAVWKWLAALAGPLTVVYLTTEHPALNQPAGVWGWNSRDILSLHAILTAAILLLAGLFARSRPALVGLLSLLLSGTIFGLTAAGYSMNVIGLSYLAGALFLLAGPDRRLGSLSNLIGIGLAALGVVGVATVLENSRWAGAVPTVITALLVWGVSVLALRSRSREKGAHSDPLLSATLVGLTFLTLTMGFDAQAYSQPGFHLMAMLMSTPCLVSLVAYSFRLAYIDELTEIPGRRALVEALDDPGNVFTLAMLDVDHFKKFNDTHGHEVGDQVLRMVAARIATVQQGFAYRYGGEEFTLLFPGKTVDQVEPELERIRQLVEASPLYLRSETRPQEKPKGSTAKAKGSKAGKAAKAKKAPSVGVTISIGVATRRTSEPWTRVMKRADQALYKAKEAGRNQVAQAG